jgi:hypothetical protein
VHGVVKGSGPGFPDGLSDLRRASTDLGFDSVQHCDTLDRLGGSRRGMRDMDLVELMPGMRPAGGFDDLPSFIEVLEASHRPSMGRSPPTFARRQSCCPRSDCVITGTSAIEVPPRNT